MTVLLYLAEANLPWWKSIEFQWNWFWHPSSFSVIVLRPRCGCLVHEWMHNKKIRRREFRCMRKYQRVILLPQYSFVRSTKPFTAATFPWERARSWSLLPSIDLDLGEIGCKGKNELDGFPFPIVGNPKDRRWAARASAGLPWSREIIFSLSNLELVCSSVAAKPFQTLTTMTLKVKETTYMRNFASAN